MGIKYVCPLCWNDIDCGREPLDGDLHTCPQCTTALVLKSGECNNGDWGMGFAIVPPTKAKARNEKLDAQ